MRFPLQGVVISEISHISFDDRFAAQIASGRSLPAYIPFTVSSRVLSFQFHGVESYKKSDMLGGGSVGSGGSVAATAFNFAC